MDVDTQRRKRIPWKARWIALLLYPNHAHVCGRLHYFFSYFDESNGNYPVA